MRISDWSSDVCSSDLPALANAFEDDVGLPAGRRAEFLGKTGAGERKARGAHSSGAFLLVAVEVGNDHRARHEPPRPAGEERKSVRVGKEGASTCRSRGLPAH